jgi:hypothetical protein
VGLDILTPKGQQTVADLDRAVALWEFNNPGYRYCRTPVDSPCPVDGLLIDRAGTLKGVVETKCRYDLTERKFEDEYKSEWLVTMDKLVRGARVASQLCVPYYGFLFLVSDTVLLTRKIADSQGQFCVPFRCDNTVTQRTVNGGEAIRANAYVDMRSSRVFRKPGA